jgi:glyoxylase-like metal-dependent hydrolase (beta-lactamase superfamily II)
MDLNKIGDWKISVLETGDFRLDGGAMMGSVPKVLWTKTNPADEQNRIDLALRCLLLDDGENIVLIETGIGDHNSEKFKKMFDIKQQEKSLSNTLSDSGYSIKDITHVILTHLHFDHAGGAVFKTVSDDFKPAFPNATYYISKSNWEAALNPSPKDRASYLKHNFICLNDSGVLKIIPDNTQILDGIETYVVNGHTHGQQLVKVKGDRETLIFCSDLIPLKSHINIPWIMGYDLNAELTLHEKTIFLSEAAENGWILFFYHDPNSVAVKIDKNDKYFEVIDECIRRRD